MTAPQLARALAPFGIRPTIIRSPEVAPAKGYYRDAFKEAWARYLPADTAEQPG